MAKKEIDKRFELTDEIVAAKGNPSFQFYECGWKCAAKLAKCTCSPEVCNRKCRHYPKNALDFFSALGFCKQIAKWSVSELENSVMKNLLEEIMKIIVEEDLPDNVKLANIRNWVKQRLDSFAVRIEGKDKKNA